MMPIKYSLKYHDRPQVRNMVQKTLADICINHLQSECQSLYAAQSAADKQDPPEDIGDLQETLQESQEMTQAASRKSSRNRMNPSVFKVRKATRKRTRKGQEREYWYSAWSVVGKARNVYLGSCESMSREEALGIARARKMMEFGIASDSEIGYEEAP